MDSLDATYRSLARPWQPDELAERYRAAHLRGASDLPPGERPPARPLPLLATAVPRLISLAVAANVLHILSTAAGGAALADELLSTIDMTVAGSLHRCHLALDASGQDAGADTAQEWLPYIYDEAAHALHALSPAADPPSLIQHAQEPGHPSGQQHGACNYPQTCQAGESRCLLRHASDRRSRECCRGRGFGRCAPPGTIQPKLKD